MEYLSPILQKKGAEMQINAAKEKIHWLGHDGFRI